jgi:hypothetical protein
MRIPFFRLLLSSVLLALPLALSSPVAAASPDLALTRTATLNGQSIPLTDVSKHSCTDADYPVIRCFNSEAALLDNMSAASQGVGGLLPLIGTTYCVWYWDGNYGGASFYQTLIEPNLSVYSWNDAISSFKELNGHYCLWYQDNNYSGISWNWGAGKSVSYVGDGANDKFSSVWIVY